MAKGGLALVGLAAVTFAAGFALSACGDSETETKRTETVTVTVQSFFLLPEGERNVRVPELVGLNFIAATRRIFFAGLCLAEIRYTRGSAAAARVVAQEPSAGVTTAAHGPVSLTLVAPRDFILGLRRPTPKGGAPAC